MRVEVYTFKRESEMPNVVVLKVRSIEGDHVVTTEMEADDAQTIGTVLLKAAAECQVPGLRIGFNHD
jgi:hypothetical protein